MGGQKLSTRDDRSPQRPRRELGRTIATAHQGSTQIFHRKGRRDRKGPPYFRKSGRLDCPELSRSPLGFSLSRVGNTGGFSACFACFAVQMQCLGSTAWGPAPARCAAGERRGSAAGGQRLGQNVRVCPTSFLAAVTLDMRDFFAGLAHQRRSRWYRRVQMHCLG